MNDILAKVLRIGVFTACGLAIFSGILFLCRYGMAELPDFTHFSYDEAHPADYTTLAGIRHGLVTFDPRSWIQLSIIALILTPVMRVVFSLIEFLKEKDWLYVGITFIVLMVILLNAVV